MDFTSKAGNTTTVDVYNIDRANSKQLENMSEVFSWALILRLMLKKNNKKNTPIHHVQTLIFSVP